VNFTRALEKFRQTAGYKAVTAKPLFREWQTGHDRIAGALAARKDPLAMPEHESGLR
jgi:hypothetical protein